MELKNYFRLEKRKILISFLLIVIAGFFTFTPLVSYVIFPFYFATILFYNIPIYFTVIIFILISYPFACYIAKNRRWLKGIILYLIAFIVISGTIVFLIFGYNKAFGHSCDTDFDCKVVYGVGAVNYRFIHLKDPFMVIDRFAPTFAFCDNGKCKALELKDVTNLEECERIKRKEQYLGDMCYFTLARKLNKKSLCNEISQTNLRESCIKEEFEKS